jgi:hypothetical protein
MSLTAPQDTLAFHMARPFTTQRDMRHVATPLVAAKIRQFMDHDGAAGTLPESEALWFYALNHGMAEVMKAKAPYEPLGDLQPFVQGYHARMGPKAVRALYYLVLICARESRHVKVHPGSTLAQSITKKHGQEAWLFNDAIRSKGSSGAYQHFLAHPPAITIGAFVESLRDIFYEGSFSGGYGGPAWGAVADCLCRFVRGEYSAEMMLDTNWTLAHNNGPIFNKGMMYASYGGLLQKILDVQRAGQVNELLLTKDSPVVTKFCPAELSDAAAWIKARFPGSVGAYVDWYAVQALGAIGNYQSDQLAQLKLHGASPLADKMQKAQAAKLQAEQAAADEAAMAHALKYFQIMPGVYVEKIARPLAA